LATAPDSYRLSVLLEVAGTQVHEDEIQKTRIILEGKCIYSRISTLHIFVSRSWTLSWGEWEAILQGRCIILVP